MVRYIYMYFNNTALLALILLITTIIIEYLRRYFHDNILLPNCSRDIYIQMGVIDNRNWKERINLPINYIYY